MINVFKAINYNLNTYYAHIKHVFMLKILYEKDIIFNSKLLY